MCIRDSFKSENNHLNLHPCFHTHLHLQLSVNLSLLGDGGDSPVDMPSSAIPPYKLEWAFSQKWELRFKNLVGKVSAEKLVWMDSDSLQISRYCEIQEEDHRRLKT